MFRPSLSTLSRVTFLLLAPLVGVLPAAHARTFAVQNLNDSGPGSLRTAIAAANSSPGADVVDASKCKGSINLLSPLPLLQSQIIINGPLTNALTLQRCAKTPFNLFSVAKGASVRLQGLTLTGGGGELETGGAVSSEGALVLLNCTLTGNTARRGGAVFSSGAFTAQNCIFTRNRAMGGGAINTSGGSLTVSTSTFSDNVSDSDGGALALQQTPTSLSRCTFNNNQAGRIAYGGAILAIGQFPLSRVGLAIDNCTFVGNSAHQGGALWNSAQRAEIKNATICSNIAALGAGIWSAGDGATYLGGSILAGNAISPSVPGRDADSNSTRNTFISRGYNLVGGGSGISSFSKIGDRRGLSLEQLLLGSLSSNGGPTQTLAPLPLSPVLDQIPASALLVRVDQRGLARPINKGGDIGAVESNAPIKSYELVVNTASDGSDGACTTENCTLREAIEEANAAATSGSTQTYTITFAPAVFSTPQVIGINQTQSFGPGLVLRGNMNIIGPGAELLSLWPGQVTESGNVAWHGPSTKAATSVQLNRTPP